MSMQDIITVKLNTALRPDHLVVVDESRLHAGHSGARADGETHYRIRCVARDFAGKSRIERHRMVNALLAMELRTSIHALALELSAPGES